MEERIIRRDGPAVPRITPTILDFRPPDQPSTPGLRLVAGYEILGELGRGGMGVVYKARQVQLNRLVALKMIRSADAGREELLRFRTEAEAVARLAHPNIVQIHEVGEHDGQPYFSLEYLEGGSLDRWLTGNPLPPDAAARLLETLARAVHFAHERGVVHRDLKPANVLLSHPSPPEAERGGKTATLPLQFGVGGKGEDVKITDFGLARWLDREARQTQTGAILGTPSYMAPEQAEGRLDAIGPAVDVYALGAILYECLTGAPPFTGTSVVATLQEVRLREPTPPSRLAARVPRDLETICLKCLEKEPARRYLAADDLADDLHRFLDGRPILARPVGPVERLIKWGRRRPSLAALLAVTVLLAGVLGAAAVHTGWRQAAAAGRRAHLRADCERALADGRDALHGGDRRAVEEAVERFAFVRNRIGDEDARADDELRRQRDQAGEYHDRAEQLLRRLNGAAIAQDRARAFLHWRDQAFFLLHRDLLPGGKTGSPIDSERAARRALDSFPDPTCLDPATRRRVQSARFEVLYLLAETAARSPDGKRLRQALAILDQICAAGGPPQAVHARRARYLEQLGDTAAASREQRLSSTQSPAGALDWYLLGLEHWRLGQTRQALECFELAVEEEPELFWAHFFRALGHQQQNNLGEARAALGACIRLQPDFLWLYLLRAFLHYREKKYSAAEADLARAERLGPDSAARYVIHVNRGLVALEQQRPRQAVRELQRAVLTLPDHYHAHVNLAQAYRKVGQHERALASLDHAVRLRPDLPALYRTRARMHQDGKAPAAALHDLDRAIALTAGQPTATERAGDHRERSRILYELHRYPEALTAARKALQLRPDEPAALRLHAELLLEMGKHAEALIAFDRFLAKGKADADVYRRRARARAGAGDINGVIDDYTHALALRRDAPLLAARGWAYLVTGAARPAFRDFEAALQLAPHSSDALVGRASARVDLGEVHAGADDAEAALRLGPKSARLLYNAARVLAKVGAAAKAPRAAALRQRALTVLREAIAATPAAERGRLWNDQVRRDSAFRALASLAGFVQLDRQYAAGRTPTSNR